MHWYDILGVAVVTPILAWVDFVLAREIKPAFRRLGPLSGLREKISFGLLVLLPPAILYGGRYLLRLDSLWLIPACLSYAALALACALISTHHFLEERAYRDEQWRAGGLFKAAARFMETTRPKKTRRNRDAVAVRKRKTMYSKHQN